MPVDTVVIAILIGCGDDSSLGIRNFVVGLIVKLSSDEATLVRERTLLNKLNLVLVQVRWISPQWIPIDKVLIAI